MRFLLLPAAALIAFAQPPSIEARFIGNMAFAISDGAATVVTDFPYQSGYSGYMTYGAQDIRSTTAATLALISHRHADHWDRALFEKTGWKAAGPDDVVAALPAARVVALSPHGTFGPVQIERLETPHAGIGHYSYVLTWHGRRLYFSGDTESIEHLVALRDLDVAFVSPWLYRSVVRRGRIDARRVVIYHHTAGEAVPECREGCLVPRQGQTIRIR